MSQESVSADDKKIVHIQPDEKEYEAQFFGCHPRVYIDRLYNLYRDIAEKDFEETRQSITDNFRQFLKKDGKNVSKEELEAILDNVQERMSNNEERYFDKLERFLFRNVFTIPEHVILPEDAVHETVSKASSDASALGDALAKQVSTKAIELRYRQAVKEFDFRTREHEKLLTQRKELLDYITRAERLVEAQQCFNQLQESAEKNEKQTEEIFNELVLTRNVAKPC